MWLCHMDGATIVWQPSTVHCFLTRAAKEAERDEDRRSQLLFRLTKTAGDCNDEYAVCEGPGSC